jgi:hypothetical protein
MNASIPNQAHAHASHPRAPGAHVLGAHLPGAQPPRRRRARPSPGDSSMVALEYAVSLLALGAAVVLGLAR